MSSLAGFGRSSLHLPEPSPELLVELAADDGAAFLEGLEQLLGGSLLGRPGERQPLDAVRVRVLGGGKAALREGELPEDVVECLLGDPAVALLAGDDPRMEVRRGEQRVVVEHLLEVRHQPPAVDRVAVEAAAEEVVHAAGGHGVEGLRDHRKRLVVAAKVLAQEELQRGRRRELRRAAEASPLGVELPAQRTGGVAEQALGQRVGRGPHLARGLDRIDELPGRGRRRGAALAIEIRDRREHVGERRHPVARLRREVRAAEERLALRGQKDRHRPAAVPGQRHDRVHVERVDVRPLLAVDLDVDEALVHEPRRLVVLEGLVLHHVAPVAGRIPDGEEDRPVLGARPLEGLVAPRVPVDGIVGVLEEVRARLLGETVHPTRWVV